MIKKIFLILFYLSLLFLGIYLYRLEYLEVPKVKNFPYLIISFILLILGFFWQCLNWKKALSVFNINITTKDAITSSGLSIFMKYIPGKVLVVLGRAAWISEKYNQPVIDTSSASLFTQILTLWIGIALGSILLLSAEINPEWQILSLIVFVGLSIALLFPVILEKTLKTIFKFLRKDISIPTISYKVAAKLIPSFTITWLFWGFGFYFLTLSLYGNPLPISLAMAFPLAGTLSIAAIFAPGGLGVREGLLVSCLIIFEIQLSEATGIAVASRLWFLIGELLLFFFAILIYLKHSKFNRSKKIRIKQNDYK